MKRFLFSLASLFLGITLFFWLLNEIGWQEIRVTLFRLSGIEGIFLFSLVILWTVLGTLRWREILKSKGYYFSLKELYGYYLASFAISYLAPIVFLGGEIFKGYVSNSKPLRSSTSNGSKEENPSKLEKGLAAGFIDGIFGRAFNWIACLLGLAVFFLIGDFSFKNPKILILPILLFLGLGVLSYFVLKKKSLIRIFFRVDEKNQARLIEKEVLSFFKIENRFFQRAFLLSSFETLLRFFQYWILIGFLGESISFFSAVSVLGISILAMAPPISADFGTHDLGSAILFSKLGFGREIGIVFASIVRGMNLILAIFGILFLIKFGFGVFQRKLFEGVNKIFLINQKNEK